MSCWSSNFYANSVTMTSWRAWSFLRRLDMVSKRSAWNLFFASLISCRDTAFRTNYCNSAMLAMMWSNFFSGSGVYFTSCPSNFFSNSVRCFCTSIVFFIAKSHLAFVLCAYSSIKSQILVSRAKSSVSLGEIRAKRNKSLNLTSPLISFFFSGFATFPLLPGHSLGSTWVEVLAAGNSSIETLFERWILRGGTNTFCGFGEVKCLSCFMLSLFLYLYKQVTN